ncbi:type II secretion system F family protein [Neorhodopirellula pilleata]|uniref:Type II secretion system protein F n=1 Tax=Neorhodopirellula pilleata TaxID=2714738 RepID=A0A5C6AHB9_9BACT|nr:type II secretion system F family protein [Neorhodopirellula pilleata]TWT98698.1 Type II secretion system protein F [Neorhodopirellula pilleata]
MFNANTYHGFSATNASAINPPAVANRKTRTVNDLFGSRKPSGAAVLLTLNQLAVMTQNGVEIAEALESVAEHCTQPRLAEALRSIHRSVSGGSTFAAAIESQREFFPASLPAILSAAEATGDIPSAISRVVEQMRAQLQMRATVIGAMIYPVILISASFFVFAALILGVLPQFQKVFDSLGKPIPTSTAYLLGTGDFCREHVWLILSGIVAAVGLVWHFRSHSVLREPFFGMLMHFPIVRSAYRPLTTGRTYRTLASMILGGVPLLESVRLTRRATVDPNWNELLAQMEQNLIEGKNPSEVLRHTTWLPAEAAQMMATGQRTGRIGEVLDDMGKYYEEEASRLLKRIIVAVEPVIILAMGVMVSGIVLSVLLPMLDVTSVR